MCIFEMGWPIGWPGHTVSHPATPQGDIYYPNAPKVATVLELQARGICLLTAVLPSFLSAICPLSKILGLG